MITLLVMRFETIEGRVIPPFRFIESDAASKVDLKLKFGPLTNGVFVCDGCGYKMDKGVLRVDLAPTMTERYSIDEKFELCFQHIEKPWYAVETYINELVSYGETLYTESLISDVKIELAKIGLKLVKGRVRIKEHFPIVLNTPTYYLFNDMRVVYENGQFTDGFTFSENPLELSSYAGIYKLRDC